MNHNNTLSYRFLFLKLPPLLGLTTESLIPIPAFGGHVQGRGTHAIGLAAGAGR